jgi:hypothetical protein
LHSFQDLTMVKMCDIVNILLFGVTIMMDAYQALRFSEYLKKWEPLPTSLRDNFLQYECTFGYVLSVKKDSLYLWHEKTGLASEIKFSECVDPTSWVVSKVSNINTFVQ